MNAILEVSAVISHTERMTTSTLEPMTDIPTDTLSVRLLIARHAHRPPLTAQEAARLVGVNPGTWRNWERGDHIKAAAKPAMLAYIASKLGVDREWLEHGGPLNPPA